jgi:hypothetical protein
MIKELSPKMLSAIEHMKRNNNKLVRFPGGYWAREGWHSWNGPCWGTPTVEALVRRGVATYTVWKTGRSAKFPIECSLTGCDLCLLTLDDNSTIVLKKNEVVNYQAEHKKIIFQKIEPYPKEPK